MRLHFLLSWSKFAKRWPHVGKFSSSWPNVDNVIICYMFSYSVLYIPYYVPQNVLISMCQLFSFSSFRFFISKKSNEVDISRLVWRSGSRSSWYLPTASSPSCQLPRELSASRSSTAWTSASSRTHGAARSHRCCFFFSLMREKCFGMALILRRVPS